MADAIYGLLCVGALALGFWWGELDQAVRDA